MLHLDLHARRDEHDAQPGLGDRLGPRVDQRRRPPHRPHVVVVPLQQPGGEAVGVDQASPDDGVQVSGGRRRVVPSAEVEGHAVGVDHRDPVPPPVAERALAHPAHRDAAVAELDPVGDHDLDAVATVDERDAAHRGQRPAGQTGTVRHHQRRGAAQQRVVERDRGRPVHPSQHPPHVRPAQLGRAEQPLGQCSGAEEHGGELGHRSWSAHAHTVAAAGGRPGPRSRVLWVARRACGRRTAPWPVGRAVTERPDAQPPPQVRERPRREHAYPHKCEEGAAGQPRRRRAATSAAQ